MTSEGILSIDSDVSSERHYQWVDRNCQSIAKTLSYIVGMLDATKGNGSNLPVTDHLAFPRSF
ncbi:hypothetical protein [Photobacterium nomapromontoriensis]|uniref:hypothetical protein n=1 Tax=Photobacterium nomapromontoriensis TaxID=2910237 RepID=UPI003D0FB6C6